MVRSGGQSSSTEIGGLAEGREEVFAGWREEERLEARSLRHARRSEEEFVWAQLKRTGLEKELGITTRNAENRYHARDDYDGGERTKRGVCWERNERRETRKQGRIEHNGERSVATRGRGSSEQRQEERRAERSGERRDHASQRTSRLLSALGLSSQRPSRRIFHCTRIRFTPHLTAPESSLLVSDIRAPEV